PIGRSTPGTCHRRRRRSVPRACLVAGTSVHRVPPIARCRNSRGPWWAHATGWYETAPYRSVFLPISVTQQPEARGIGVPWPATSHAAGRPGSYALPRDVTRLTVPVSFPYNSLFLAKIS